MGAGASSKELDYEAKNQVSDDDDDDDEELSSHSDDSYDQSIETATHLSEVSSEYESESHSGTGRLRSSSDGGTSTGEEIRISPAADALVAVQGAETALAQTVADYKLSVAEREEAEEGTAEAQARLDVANDKLFNKKEKAKALSGLGDCQERLDAAVEEEQALEQALEHNKAQLQQAQRSHVRLSELEQRRQTEFKDRRQQQAEQAAAELKQAELERRLEEEELERVRQEEAAEARAKAAEAEVIRVAALKAEAEQQRLAVEKAEREAKERAVPLYIFAPGSPDQVFLGGGGGGTGGAAAGGPHHQAAAGSVWLQDMAARFARQNEHRRMELMRECMERGLPHHGDVDTMLARLAVHSEGFTHLLLRWKRWLDGAPR